MVFILSFTSFPHFREETRVSVENQPAENKFVPLSQRALSCAAHPLSHTIITGTQVGFVVIPYIVPASENENKYMPNDICLNFYGIGEYYLFC